MITVDFDRLDIRPGYNLLDIGSGPGRHTGAASRFTGVTAIGADIRYEDITEAKNRLRFQEKIGECRGKWGLLTTNIFQLPFADGTFDGVICAEVLEHLSDDRAAALEIVRVLKPGGDLVVSVPRAFPEKICWSLSKEYTTAKGGHVRIYTRKILQTLLETSGASFRFRHYAHSLHTPFWWLKCLVGPNRNDSWAVNAYHRLLVWDLMKKPAVTRFIDRLLNPLMGKSLVCYLRKLC
jgi:ubiquinone/menaquinone biosynthesis C-methylase UbiE